MEIREAQHRDRAAVLGFAARLTEGVAPWRDADGALTAAHGWLEQSLADGAALVAVDGERVVGVVSVARQRHFTGAVDACIGELAVAPDATRRGVGLALVAAAEDWAAAQGLRQLTLQTGAANHGARRFYAALGFAEEEVRLTRAVRSAVR